jgi:hypothetical protein
MLVRIHHVCILPVTLILPRRHQSIKPRSLVRSDMQPRIASSHHTQALVAYFTKSLIMLTSATKAEPGIRLCLDEDAAFPKRYCTI